MAFLWKPALFALLLTACAQAPGGVIGAAAPFRPAEAVAAVMAAHPELSVYRTTTLPPHSIETAVGPDGSHQVAFLRSGSGVDSILDASCFVVKADGSIVKTGTFRRGAADVHALDLATCRPR
jgi:hypothetical protein